MCRQVVRNSTQCNLNIQVNSDLLVEVRFAIFLEPKRCFKTQDGRVDWVDLFRCSCKRMALVNNLTELLVLKNSGDVLTR